jgi:hypothetical protein
MWHGCYYQLSQPLAVGEHHLAAPSLVFNTEFVDAVTSDPDEGNNSAEAVVQVTSPMSLWIDVVWSNQGDILTAYFNGTRLATVVADPDATLDSPTIAPDGNRLGLAQHTGIGTEVCAYNAPGLVCVDAPGLTAGLDWAADSRTLYYNNSRGGDRRDLEGRLRYCASGLRAFPWH